jgi:hypothetical protein
MSHAKQSSKPRTRNKVVPMLGAAGLSLSLASGTAAATAELTADMLMRNTGASHKITLGEQEISDVTLATFYVVNKENAGTFQPGRQLAMGGGGGCGGCAGCAGGTSNYGATPEGDVHLQQRSIKPAYPAKRTHVPKNQ